MLIICGRIEKRALVTHDCLYDKKINQSDHQLNGDQNDCSPHQLSIQSGLIEVTSPVSPHPLNQNQNASNERCEPQPHIDPSIPSNLLCQVKAGRGSSVSDQVVEQLYERDHNPNDPHSDQKERNRVDDVSVFVPLLLCLVSVVVRLVTPLCFRRDELVFGLLVVFYFGLVFRFSNLHVAHIN